MGKKQKGFIPETKLDPAVEAFCSATGLEVCIKLLQGSRHPNALDAIAVRRSLHVTPFCLGVKRTRNDRCRDCDLRRVPERCAAERGQFTHVCHAGANEIIVPLYTDDTLTAVVYVGQFRVNENQPATLRLVSPDELKRMEGLARLLGAYLGERLRTPRFVSESSPDYRGEAIGLFLRKNLRSNPSLSDLARHLGLSVPRTAHVVREAFGRSFVTVRDELRLERATALLAGTFHKVGHVAEECGFSSQQYFHRFFRSHKRMTPLSYRRRQRTAA